MTQENNQSVRNAEATETASHIPTFEEVYAMPYVRESIECMLDQDIRLYPILAGNKDDLRQDILIYLNKELPKFMPGKSSIQTFARMTIRSGLRMARRNYFSLANRAIANAKDIRDFELHDDNALSDEDFRAYSSCAKNNVDGAMLEVDVHETIASIPEPYKTIAKKILAGTPIRVIEREMDIPHCTFRRKYLLPLRQIFAEKDF